MSRREQNTFMSRHFRRIGVGPKSNLRYKIIKGKLIEMICDRLLERLFQAFQFATFFFSRQNLNILIRFQIFILRLENVSNALPFYRSQNVLRRSKFFEPSQKFDRQSLNFFLSVTHSRVNKKISILWLVIKFGG